MKRSKHNIHTGRLIEKIRKEKNITKKDLGELIGRTKTTVATYFDYSSIQTDILLDLSHGLKHNFFRDIADQLPEDFARTNPENRDVIITKDQILAEKDNLIEALQEEIKILKIQNELMWKTISVKG